MTEFEALVQKRGPEGRQMERQQASSALEVKSGMLAMLRQPVVTYGAELSDALGNIAKHRDVKRIFPVVTKSLSNNEHLNAALERLGGCLPRFSELKPHTPFEVILALAERIKREKPDLVCVFGGGSAIDAAKVATVVADVEHLDREGLLALRAVPDARGMVTTIAKTRAMPVVAVPTTLSGAEFGVIAGGTDTQTGIKHLFRSETLGPEVIVYDPAFVRATPMDLWLSTGIRALDHGIETVLSLDANAFTDALALRGIALLCDGLSGSRRAPDDVHARHLSQLGVWLAGSGIGRVRYGASHGLGHQLGAIAGVPHGLTSCVLLPAVLDFNIGHTEAEQRQISAAMGRAGAPASDVVRDFIASLGLPTRLSELKVDKAALPRVAESALNNAFVRANRRPISSTGDVMQILERAY